MPAPRAALFTTRYLLMWSFSFAVFFSVFQLLPTAPFHVIDLGGSKAAAGLFLGLLTYCSAASAPIMGALADRVGKRRMLLTCSLAIGTLSGAYAVAPGYRTLLVLATLHGVVWSGLLSASAAYMTDLIPESRRAEGIGYWGLATNLAIAVAPKLGFALYRRGWVWVCVSIATLNLVMAGIATLMRETAVRVWPHNERFLSRRLVEWRVLALSGTLFLYSFGYGGITSFVALFADTHGIAPHEIFFTVFAIVVIASRFFVGAFGDRLDARRTMVPCLVLIATGLALLATLGSTRGWMIVSAIVFAAGFGVAYPVYATHVVRHVDANRRGAAFGGILAAFDTGVGTGSIAFGWLIEHFGFPAAFAFAAGLAALAVPYFLWMDRRVWSWGSAPPQDRALHA